MKLRPWHVMVRGQVHPCHFTSVENMWNPLDKRIGGSQGWSGRCEDMKHVMPLPGIEQQLLGNQASRLVTILSYPGILYLDVQCILTLQWE
jgi:hypothetical protein